MPEDSLPPPGSDAEVSVREARASDINGLAAIETRAFVSDRLTRRSFARLARSRSAHLLVALRGNDLLGYALVLTRRGIRSARLYSVAVDPDWERQGLGRTLLRAAERAALVRGADRLSLEVRADNAAAIRLYERAGYRRTGERANYYADGAPALQFARPLAGPELAGGDGARPTLDCAA